MVFGQQETARTEPELQESRGRGSRAASCFLSVLGDLNAARRFRCGGAAFLNVENGCDYGMPRGNS